MIIYVASDGNDRNPGTQDRPLETLLAARQRVRTILRGFGSDGAEDITVHLAPGIHRLREVLLLGPEDCADGACTVTWRGSGNGETVISSGSRLEGWQRCEDEPSDLPESVRGRIWFVDLPSGTQVKTVYGDNGSIPRARGEAIKPCRLSTEDGARAKWYGSDDPSKVGAPRKQGDDIWFHDRFGFREGAIVPASDLDEAEFAIIPAMQWTMNILHAGEIDFENRIVHLKEACTYPIGVPGCAPDGSIWLENSLSVIQPGAWVYHAKEARLYYCPEGDEPPAGLEAACLTEFIRVEGRHDLHGEKKLVAGVHFKNLGFTRSNRFSFHGLTGRGIQHDWEMHDAPSCMVRFRHAQQCSVSDCRFYEAGSGGLRMDLTCSDNRVERCEFEHLGGCGIVLCGYGLSRHYLHRRNKVLHNHIHHIGEHYWHCPAIFIWQSGDNHIAHNHLHDTPYTAIVCSGRTVFDREGRGECSGTIHWEDVEEQCGKGYEHTAWCYSGLPSWWIREPLMHSRENLIEYNHIHDVMQIMGDGNGIYISGAGGGNVVRFNVVGPCPSPTMAEGIRCDDDQHHTIIHGNLIFGQGGQAIGITLKGINRVTNNILAMPVARPARGMLSLETGPLNGSVIQRNIIYTSAADQKFVGEMRIHGQGRKARVRDTHSDSNIYFCETDPRAGQAWLQELRSFGTDVQSRACDPGFVDAENGNYALKETSPALQMGFEPLPLDQMFTHQWRR